MTDAELCQHRTVFEDDDFEDGVKCHRDSVGEFEIVAGGDVIAVMGLCEDHRDHFRERFKEVRHV